MKHVIIAAHPNENSFTMAMAQAYMDAAMSRGYEIVLRDLYRMKFDPVLPADELPWSDDFAPAANIVAEHKLLSNADVFALIYPFWFNAPPAILKGYLERVFGPGFAYQPTPHGGDPLLTGRSLISITSSGAPTHWVVKTGGLDASRKLFDEHFAAVCGLSVIDHLHFGGIVPGIRPDIVSREAEKVRATFLKHF